MLTSLHIKNFKAWKDSGEVRLTPVTLLLGSNSTGKSSLIQSLLLLKQTVASPDRSIHLNLGGDEANDFFNFGQFDDVLTSGAENRRFEIEFYFKRSGTLGAPGIDGFQNGGFHASYAMTSRKAAVVERCRLIGPENKYRVVRREKGAYSVYVGEEVQPRGKQRAFAPERSIALPAEAIQVLGTEGGYAQDLSLAIRRELEGIAYLGPLRRSPERDYVWNKTKPGDLGLDGSAAINALFADTFLQGKDKGQDIVRGVSEYLSRMQIAEKLEVRPLGRSTRYAIVVHHDGVAANLKDVGIGISQVLPVLTLAFFVPPGSTVLLEEPEIHLHPLAQSVLAELFVEISRKRKIQFIVETHSEHLFRRLQTLIAGEKLTINGCAMYFVEREGAKALLRALEVNEFGAITNWPEKFFGDALGETREQARLMFERQKKDRPK